MRWLALALTAPLAACVTTKQYRAVEAQVDELTTRLSELEARLEPLLPPSPKAEAESRVLLEQALSATDELRWDDAKALLAQIGEGYPNTTAAQVAERVLEEVDVIGRDAVALEVEQWFQGSEADLTDDKATLYVFWEAWCPHCQREVPKLSATYDQFREKGLGMVGLTEMSRDVTPEQVAEFIEERGVTYPIAKESKQALALQYGIRGIPAAAMVHDGKVVWRGHPASLTDAIIESVLAL